MDAIQIRQSPAGDGIASLRYYAVFSTKNHRRLIAKDWEEELYAYMAGILRAERGRLLKGNGATGWRIPRSIKVCVCFLFFSKRLDQLYSRVGDHHSCQFTTPQQPK